VALDVSLRRRLKGGLGAALFASGLHRLALRNRGLVAVFHRVDARYPGDPITVSPEFFTRCCAFFAARFTVVGFGQFVEMLQAGASLGGHLAITFDDGYRDNHAVAAPILERFRLPACFFVSSGFIGTEDTPDWDRRAGVVSEWMDWVAVRDLHRRGFEIGSHTAHHVDLGLVHGDEARREILDGRAALEQGIGGPVRLFSYPFGRREQISEANREFVRESGFSCCASAYGGTVASGSDPFRLRRFPVSNWHLSVGQYGFEAALSRWD
jgi:peptidoglycan/xylan/chitin deacetylase (PgdA/CDA1 family)